MGTHSILPETSCNKLTIGIATYDDWHGVWFTISSLLVHHPQIFDLVLIDNSPDTEAGKLCRRFMKGIGKYVPFPYPTGTAHPRDEIFRQAVTPYVLVLDSHVLLWPNTLPRLLSYFAECPNTLDLLQGPLMKENGKFVGTHQNPDWRGGAWGVWATDPDLTDLNALPKVIWQQGMGLFACRREEWVGFHPEMRGFGGCESYIAEKVRRRGSQVMCLPFLRWVHRREFPERSDIVREDDKLHNYIVGFEELDLDIQPVLNHFSSLRRRTKKNGLITVVGENRFGEVRMRGAALSTKYQCKRIDPDQIHSVKHSDIIISIRCCDPSLRDRCDRLIFDPMATDCQWRAMWESMRFDDILATSITSLVSMQSQLPSDVRVHLVSHHFASFNQASFLAEINQILSS